MPRLLVNSQGPAGLALDLGAGLYRIGRSSGNDLQIDHPSISTAHCEVMLVNGAVLVRDLDSTNGTFIDSQPVKEACLIFGQRLQVGIVELMLEEPLRVSALQLSNLGQSAALAPPPNHVCSTHPDTEATFSCPRCEQFYCASCVRHLRRMDGTCLRLCPTCAVECEQIARLPELPVPLEVGSPPSAIGASPSFDETGARSVRMGLVPHLATWLKSKLLHGLLSQRRQLLAVQAVATRQAEEFEKRLADVQVEMRQRIKDYEDRIAALENELAAAELEKRELIRNQIVLMKRALAEERAQEQFSNPQPRSFQLSSRGP